MVLYRAYHPSIHTRRVNVILHPPWSIPRSLIASYFDVVSCLLVPEAVIEGPGSALKSGWFDRVYTMSWQLGGLLAWTPHQRSASP